MKIQPLLLIVSIVLFSGCALLSRLNQYPVSPTEWKYSQAPNFDINMRDEHYAIIMQQHLAVGGNSNDVIQAKVHSYYCEDGCDTVCTLYPYDDCMMIVLWSGIKQNMDHGKLFACM